MPKKWGGPVYHINETMGMACGTEFSSLDIQTNQYLIMNHSDTHIKHYHAHITHH